MNTEKDPLDLLRVLHATISLDRGAPGLLGTVAIGVRSNDVTQFWIAALAGAAEPSFSSEEPAADATLILGEREALAILSNGDFPSDATEVTVSGDAELLQRFVVRYFKKANTLSLRLPPEKPRRAPKQH